MAKVLQEEVLLEKVLTEENVYNWKEAAKLYEKIAELFLNKNKKKKAAEFYYKSGWSFFYAAYASKNVEELKENSKNLLRTLRKAANINKKIGNLSDELECKGLILLTQAVYFMESKQDVLNLAKKSVEILNRSIEIHEKDKKSKSELARKLNKYTLATAFLVYCSTDAKDVEETLQKGINYAHEAWKISRDIKDLEKLADSLDTEWLLWNSLIMVKDFKQDKFWEDNLRNFLSRCDESQEIIGECKNSQILRSIYAATGLAYFNFGFHYIQEEIEQRKYLDKGIKLIEKSIVCARETGNNFALIYLLFSINFYTLVAGRIQYLQKRISKDINEVTKKGMIFKTSNLPTYISANYLPAMYYSNFAQRSFFTTSQRKSYADKGIEYAQKALGNSVSDVWDCFSHQAASWSYSQLISLTTSKEDRKNFIQKMIKHANQAKENADKFEGGISRALGFSSLYRAYRTLSDIADNKKEKIKMLNVAIDASKNYI
ncbi:MAG: hypothetical protein ACFE9M_08035, partial [Promethearchaeota archaeon]